MGPFGKAHARMWRFGRAGNRCAATSQSRQQSPTTHCGGMRAASGTVRQPRQSETSALATHTRNRSTWPSKCWGGLAGRWRLSCTRGPTKTCGSAALPSLSCKPCRLQCCRGATRTSPGPPWIYERSLLLLPPGHCHLSAALVTPATRCSLPAACSVPPPACCLLLTLPLQMLRTALISIVLTHDPYRGEQLRRRCNTSESTNL